MNKHQELAIRALSQMKGDDLYRARAAFGNLTVNDYNHKIYGCSGKTPAQIIKEYEEHNDRIEAAINWVKNIVDNR